MEANKKFLYAVAKSSQLGDDESPDIIEQNEFFICKKKSRTKKSERKQIRNAAERPSTRHDKAQQFPRQRFLTEWPRQSSHWLRRPCVAWPWNHDHLGTSSWRIASGCPRFLGAGDGGRPPAHFCWPFHFPGVSSVLQIQCPPFSGWREWEMMINMVCLWCCSTIA